jgi:predicted dinucleotide-binding enzyme
MRIGILGSGLMGGKLGTIFARAGHDVVFSYSHSERKLERLAREAKGSARAGTPAEAAEGADAVLLAVHWSRVDDVLKQAGKLSHVPVNADVHEIETMFVEEDDRIASPLGVKGMGELGMVGIPAAIANAVFHATGKRVRELPITPEKLL